MSPLNVHVPEAQKTTLPSPEKVKEILDHSVQRIRAADLGKKKPEPRQYSTVPGNFRSISTLLARVLI